MRGLKSALTTAMRISLIAVGSLNMVLDICSIADTRNGALGVGLHCIFIQSSFMLEGAAVDKSCFYGRTDQKDVGGTTHIPTPCDSQRLLNFDIDKHMLIMY